jgi:putative SOS response-associated peptidase YedK
MPVILGAKAVDVWLKPGDMAEEAAAKILVPAPKTFLVEFEVSIAVNSPKTDHPVCIEAVA